MSRQTRVRSRNAQDIDGLWRRAVKRRLTAVGAVVLLLVGVSTGVWAANGRGGLVGFITASDEAPNGCATQEIFIGVRGSGETEGMGPTVRSVFERYRDDLRQRNVAVAGVWVDYEAVSVPRAIYAASQEFGKATRYDNSEGAGQSGLLNAMLHWVQKCPNARLAVAGYSQGADAVARVLESLNPNLAADAAILTRLDGAALFGDPAYNPADQRADALQGRVHGGFLRFVDSNHRGLRPAFPAPLADRVLSWCAAGDFVCDASGDDFSHYAASLAQQGLGGEHTNYTNTSYPTAAADWLAQRVGQAPPSAPIAPHPGAGTPVAPCETLVRDVTLPDGTALAPNQQATKVWALRNCGATAWTATTANLVTGTGAPSSFQVPPLVAGASGDVSLTFTAPTPAGHYRWAYRLGNAAGAAQGTFWLDFNVGGTPSAGPGPATAGQTSCTAFVADGNLPDGTAVDPGQTLTKTWRLRNCGTSDWSALHAARVSGGFGLDTFSVPSNSPGATTSVSTTFAAPQTPGRYRATYRLVDGAGNFARNTFWVEIVVRAATQPKPSPSTSQTPPNRYGVASYDRLAPGASHAEWYQAWQDFTAASNTLTRLQINVGDPRWAAGAIPVNTTIRLCLDSGCKQQLGSWQAQINNYGTTTAEIGDFTVSKGARYYMRYDRPDTAHSWAVYYWGPNTYDNLSAAIYGYDR